MMEYITSETDKDLLDIIALQKSNLPGSLTPEEMQSQGFVTVVHSLEVLKKMNTIEQSIIVKDDNKVIAYLLAMTEKSKHDIPILIPMFEMFGKIEWGGRPLADYNYIVVGQVCVDKAYRGKGILDDCYATYKAHFKNKYDFAVTEIAIKNGRSINAHKRIGFTEVHRYSVPNGEVWSMVVWDWR
jgi:predicted GNAT superfamily acetyltransferase